MVIFTPVVFIFVVVALILPHDLFVAYTVEISVLDKSFIFRPELFTVVKTRQCILKLKTIKINFRDNSDPSWSISKWFISSQCFFAFIVATIFNFDMFKVRALAF